MIGYAPIDFGQPNNLDLNSAMINPESYFTTTLDFILDKYKSSTNEKIQELLSKNLLKQIETIEIYLKDIKEGMKETNFYEVLAFCHYHLNDEFFDFVKKKITPKNLNSILLTYAFIRLNKDFLVDIDDHPKRYKKYRALLKIFRKGKNRTYPDWIDLDNYKKNILSILKDSEARAIQRGLQFEKNILNLYKDVMQAAYDLDGYNQHLYDLYRGK